MAGSKREKVATYVHHHLPSRWHKQQAAAGMGVIAQGIRSAAAIAATVAPVPYLSMATALVDVLVKLVENFKSNKHLMGQLSERCRELLRALMDSSASLAPEKLRQMNDSSIQLLDEIIRRMKEWSLLRPINQFLLQNLIADDIKQSHAKIDAFIERFHLQGHILTHTWMATHEAYRARDHAEVVNHLSDIRNQANLIEEMVGCARADCMGILHMMNDVVSRFTPSDHRRRGFAQNYSAMRRATQDVVPSPDIDGEALHCDDGGPPPPYFTGKARYCVDVPLTESPVAISRSPWHQN